MWWLAAAFGAAVAQADLPRERIEWCDIWIADAEREDVRRVLLIGDSIARGYYGEVEHRLAGCASLARLTTSRCVADPVFFRELDLLLGEYNWDVIHVNNGLHGFGFSEEQYRDALSRLFALLAERAPESRVIWASSTPIRDPGELTRLAEGNRRVTERNAIAAELAHAAGVAIDDLYGAVADHPEYHAADGVHFTDAGRRAQGEQVAALVGAVLEAGDQ